MKMKYVRFARDMFIGILSFLFGAILFSRYWPGFYGIFGLIVAFGAMMIFAKIVVRPYSDLRVSKVWSHYSAKNRDRAGKKAIGYSYIRLGIIMTFVPIFSSVPVIVAVKEMSYFGIYSILAALIAIAGLFALIIGVSLVLRNQDIFTKKY